MHDGFVALLAEGVDRNNISGGGQSDDEMSPSSRRAWIEIAPKPAASQWQPVALLAEGVDRNAEFEVLPTGEKVALLAEGVDRNNFLARKG